MSPAGGAVMKKTRRYVSTARQQQLAAGSGVNGIGPLDVNENAVRRIEQGMVMTKLYPRKRPEKRMFRVRRESLQLIWARTQSSLTRPEDASEYKLDSYSVPGCMSRVFANDLELNDIHLFSMSHVKWESFQNLKIFNEHM